MTEREQLIGKLADEMDPDHARAFVDRVIAEAVPSPPPVPCWWCGAATPGHDWFTPRSGAPDDREPTPPRRDQAAAGARSASAGDAMTQAERIAAFEKNGIRLNERVVCIDHPTRQGTVTFCSRLGVEVIWDDGQTGDLAWDDRVAYNAYRLQVVRKAVR